MVRECSNNVSKPWRIGTYDMLGPTATLFSLTYAYATCMLPRSSLSSSVASGCCAARMTRAMTSVADRETPH